jgi:hypothetical protein
LNCSGCPNIGRILGHKDRQVAHDADAAFVAVTFQGEPLPEKEKLIEHLRFDFFVEFVASVVESVRCAVDER